jgi:hypothetical protein
MLKMPPARNGLILMAAFFIIIGLGSSGSVLTTILAQDATPTPSPTPLSPEEQRLADEKKILTLAKDNAELRKAIAEANKAETEAKFPKPSTTPLAGTTTVSDGAVIESQIVAYVSMAKAANSIITGINTHPVNIKNLAIYNERDVNLLLSYRVANNQVKVIQDSYCGLLAPTETIDPSDPTGQRNFCAKAGGASRPQRELFPLFTAAQSFLGGFIDLTALLRTNVEIKGQTFDIDEAPLVAEVFRAARRPSVGLPNSANLNLYYPLVMPPNISLDRPSDILSALQRLRSLRARAGKLLDDLVKTNEEIEKSKTKIKSLSELVNTLPRKEAADKASAVNLFSAYTCAGIAAGEDILDRIDRAIGGGCPLMPGEKRERLLELRDSIKETRAQLAEANDGLQAEKDNLGKLKTRLNELAGKINPAFNTASGLSFDDAVAQLKAVNEQFDKFVNALIAVDATAGVNPLTNYIRAENLLSVLPRGAGSYWLQLKVLKAGGNNRIKTNLIVDIFTGGNRLSHSGGVIVEYNLFDDDGRSVASDTITDYTNYIKANKVKSLPSSEVDNRPTP